MVEWQTRHLEVVVPNTGVGVRIPPGARIPAKELHAVASVINLLPVSLFSSADRAPDSESGGRWFESSKRHKQDLHGHSRV